MIDYDVETNVFKMLREEENLTQQELGKQIELSYRVISGLETGGSVSLESLKAYHKRFNVPYEYLLGESTNRHYENQTLERELGLTERAIEVLKYLKDLSKEEPEYKLILQSINYLLSSTQGYMFLFHLSTYLFGMKPVKGKEDAIYLQDSYNKLMFMPQENYNSEFEAFKLTKDISNLKRRDADFLANLKKHSPLSKLSNEELIKMFNAIDENEKAKSERFIKVPYKEAD